MPLPAAAASIFARQHLLYLLFCPAWSDTCLEPQALVQIVSTLD